MALGDEPSEAECEHISYAVGEAQKESEQTLANAEAASTDEEPEQAAADGDVFTSVGTDFTEDAQHPPECLVVRGSEIRGLNGMYRRCPGRIFNGLPVWEKADQARVLFYSSRKERWYISDKTEDKGYAYASSDAELPLGLAWSNGTTVTKADGAARLERRSSLMRGVEHVKSMGKLFTATLSRTGAAPPAACDRDGAEDLVSNVSGASTSTGGSGGRSGWSSEARGRGGRAKQGSGRRGSRESSKSGTSQGGSQGTGSLCLRERRGMPPLAVKTT